VSYSASYYARKLIAEEGVASLFRGVHVQVASTVITRLVLVLTAFMAGEYANHD
jgi:hypothetical protein